MGTGWVRETLDHDYTDAQRRGHPVALLVTETTGAWPWRTFLDILLEI